MDSVKFDRKPYFVHYTDSATGERKSIRRVPPPKLHSALPGDVVELTSKKSDDFDAGDRFTVKHINPRHPNVLQIKDDDGKTTFVNWFEARLDEMVAPRAEGQAASEPGVLPIKSDYLLWP